MTEFCFVDLSEGRSESNVSLKRKAPSSSPPPGEKVTASATDEHNLGIVTVEIEADHDDKNKIKVSNPSPVCNTSCAVCTMAPPDRNSGRKTLHLGLLFNIKKFNALDP